MSRRVFRNGSVRRATTFAALIVTACGPKGPEFFSAPLFTTPPPLVDVTLPIISNLLPIGNVVLNDGFIGYSATDGVGAAGEPVSGLNIPGMTALFSTTPLGITAGTPANYYLIDIGPVLDGLNTVNLRVPDIKGNFATASYSFRKDRTAPTFTGSVPATGSSTQLSSSLNLQGTYADQHGFSVSTAYIRQAVNGQCTTTAPLFGQGTGAGTVSQNTFQLDPLLGAFSLNLNLNGAPNDQRPRTTTYCVHYALADPAVDRFGAPRPNQTDRLFPVTYTWELMPVPTRGGITGRVTLNGNTPLPGVIVTAGGQSQTTDANGNYTLIQLLVGDYTVTLSNLPSATQCVPISKVVTVPAGLNAIADFNCTQTNFSIALLFLYVHVGPGISYACSTITGTLTSVRGSETVTLENIALENIAGASYTVTWSGPGTVGSTTRNGTLPASSQVLDRQQINAFGTYTANVSVTYNGVTKQASGNVSVGGTQGTCTPPP